VINHQKEGSYIFTWDEFIFYEGVLRAMKIFAAHFKYIFIVTNQRGIGKGMMTVDDLHHIHHNMKKSIELAGGRVDGIYYCADIEAESHCRKPNTGMAVQAKKDFPDVNFNKAVMVGNSPSDMEFGNNIGAVNIFLTTTKPATATASIKTDAIFSSLPGFAEALLAKS
jgi:histidinol-phosphate phosphatase family protein